jgi:hypothetical protein
MERHIIKPTAKKENSAKAEQDGKGVRGSDREEERERDQPTTGIVQFPVNLTLGYSERNIDMNSNSRSTVSGVNVSDNGGSEAIMAAVTMGFVVVVKVQQSTCNSAMQSQ